MDISKYAVIDNGIVVNVVIWDGESDWSSPVGCSIKQLPPDSPVGVGYAFDGSNFAPPVYTPPTL
jgi:hypothetical protein